MKFYILSLHQICLPNYRMFILLTIHYSLHYYASNTLKGMIFKVETITADQYLVKKINKALILRIIREHSPLSKPDIVTKSGLNRGTVSRLVNELEAASIIKQLGEGISSGGRKPTMYTIKGDSGFVIGITVKSKLLEVALADLNGKIVKRFTKELTSKTPKFIIKKIIESIKEMQEYVQESIFQITCIGIGFPGMVDANGTVLKAPSLKWNDVDLRQMIVDTFQIPCVVDNEARVGLIGEKQFDKHNALTDTLYVSVSNVIGSAVTIKNELFRGYNGLSGEAGHLIVKYNGKKCSCGSKGCWQMYASTNALLKKLSSVSEVTEQLHASPFSQLSVEFLESLASQGNQFVIKEIEEIGQYLGIGLISLVNVLNPKNVLIGGDITKLKEWVEPSLNETLRASVLPDHNKGLDILFSELGSDSTIIGAIAVALTHFFENGYHISSE
ncbi:ROK family transcriptional regulator [Oceanobacillus timonensis]|uniref:ROK family transcriptional regulator n=1 Tax=Oceanobacillus timonensis TaxID=1926285 RepID=UPI0009BB7D89|nr:ROK family transcriptional regulator [Oceanobacillus timonensis]